MRNGRPCVMVVDADPETLAADYRLLVERGFRVATYRSPGAACGYAATEKPEAVLMSFDYPECDGLTAVRRLKAASPGSHILMRVGPNQRPSPGEAAQAGAEVIRSGTPGSETVLRGIEEAIGELSATAGR